MFVRSRSSHVLTISLASVSCELSMRMSSGASTEYEKPRSGRSSCIDETPRSRRIASTCTSFAASCGSTTAKSPRSKRVCTVENRFAKRSKYAWAVGSRSTAISFPRPCRSAASSDECPPAPNVPSSTVSPGCTARDSRTSPARTGTWSVALGCKTFGNMLRTPFDLCQLAAPGVAIPDLEVVVDSRDDDVAVELRVLQERGGETDATLLVQLRLGCAGEEEALHPAALLAQRVERPEPALDEHVPVGARVGEETAVHAARHDDPAREALAEASRQREPVLVVDRVLVFTEKHLGPFSFSTTLPHDKPRFPICP